MALKKLDDIQKKEEDFIKGSFTEKPKKKVIKKDSKEKVLPTSFRLKESDKLRLKEIVKVVNDISSSDISETGIIRALILLGSKIQKNRIIKAYKDLV